MSRPFDNLGDFLAAAWALMAVEIRPMRRLSMANLDATGKPQLRTLVLREVDMAKGTIAMHTDAASSKVADIRRDGRMAVVIWDEEQVMQIRLTGTAIVQDGEKLRNIWDQLPHANHGNYGVMPPPGSEIARGDGYSREPDAAKFARIIMTADAIDLVQLVEPSHRRACFHRADNWAGKWLAP